MPIFAAVWDVTEILKLVAQGSVGVAIIVVIWLNNHQRDRERVSQDRRDQKIADAIKDAADQASEDRKRSDDLTERLFDRVIDNAHEMAQAISGHSHALAEHSQAIGGLRSMIERIERDRPQIEAK